IGSHGAGAATGMSSGDYSVELRADANQVFGIYRDEKAQAAKLTASGSFDANKVARQEQRYAVDYADAIAQLRADAPPSGVDSDLKLLWRGMIEYGTIHRQSDLALASDLVAYGKPASATAATNARLNTRAQANA